MGKFKPKHTGMGVNERSEEKERSTYGKVTKKKKIWELSKSAELNSIL